MTDVLFRASSIGKIMAEPKTKAEGPLSVGARTYIRSLAAQSILGIDFEFSSKETEKGLLVEQQGIDMLNRVRGLSLVKNTERRSANGMTGECDLFNAPARRGHDLKCSWSAATFPITVADCKDSLYEWQARVYMALWDADEWSVDYALITTPETLTRWEPLFMHFVDHIPEHMRLTSWTIQRDAEKEARMVEKVKHARAYFAEVVEEFAATHQPISAHVLAACATEVA